MPQLKVDAAYIRKGEGLIEKRRPELDSADHALEDRIWNC